MHSNALFAAALTIAASGCSKGNPYAGQINKHFLYSPDRTHAAVVVDRTLMQERWLRSRKTVGKETILSLVRAEKPYTERPSTSPNPEMVFLTASCPNSDFSVTWADNSHLDVAVEGCTTGNLKEKKAQVADVSINYP